MSKQLLKDTAFYGASDLILKVLSFFTFPILVNLLSVNDFGIITLASTFAGFLGMFINLGINSAVQRFYFDNETPDKDKKIIVSSGLWTLLFWGFFLSVLFILITYPLNSLIIKKFELPWIYLTLSVLAILPSTLLNYCNDTIRLHFKPIKFLILSFIKNLSAIIAGIIVLKYYNGGIKGYLLVSFIVPLVFVPLGIWLIKKDIVFSINKTWIKKIVKFGYPFVFAGLAYWLFGSMDRWLLSEMCNNTQVGLYSIAFKLGAIIMFVNSAFGQAWSPVAIKMMNENKDAYKKQFAKILTIYFWILVIIGCILCLFTKEFFVFLTPKDYWLAANSSIWIILGIVISGTTQITAVGISIEKKTHLFSRISWITAIINLVLNLIFIPKFGATGSAFATAITYLILTLFYYYYTQKLHYFPFEYFRLFIAFITILSICIISIYFNQYTTIKFTIIKSIIAFCVIFVGYYFNKDDIKNVKQLFLKN